MKQLFLFLQLLLILLTLPGLHPASAEYFQSPGSPGSPVRRSDLRRDYREEDLYSEPDYDSEAPEGSGQYEEAGLGLEERSFTRHSDCEIKYELVSVVKQVPSFSKHCHKVEDTKCKTLFKNAFQTQIETQCVASFDTSCDTIIHTAYKQECQTIKDVECRIANLEDHAGGHHSQKICEDVPTEKCVPVPVKVEGQQCVNVPVQKCENVPVTAPVEVPSEKCYKKPRKVCQTLVSTKPKVVTAKVPREHCGHRVAAQKTKPPIKSTRDIIKTPSISRSFNQNTYSEEDLNRNDNFQQYYEYLLSQNSQNIRGN